MRSVSGSVVRPELAIRRAGGEAMDISSDETCYFTPSTT